MESTTHKVDYIEIDTSLIPNSVSNEFCRIVLRGVRELFSNMTPAQREDYEHWKAEYRKRKAMKGGDECEQE